MAPDREITRRRVMRALAYLGFGTSAMSGFVAACSTEKPAPRPTAKAEPTATSKAEARSLSVNVKDHGAVGDGRTDDTAAIRRAIAKAMAGSATVLLPAGTYGISSELQFLGFNASVNLVGAGKESSILKALTPAACISWGGAPAGPGAGGQTLFGRPSRNDGWKFDGNLLATRGITIGSTAGYGTWRNVWSTKVRGDGWAAYPQNSTFHGCIGDGCSGNGWTLDYGIQECDFTQCHASANDGWGFEVRQSGGPGWGNSAQPQALRFTSGIVEQGGSPFFARTGLGGVHIREGVDITFDRFELVDTAGDAALVLTPSTANGYVGRIVVRDCRVQDIHINANVNGVAQTMGGTNEPLFLTGWNHFAGPVVNGSTGRVYSNGIGQVPYLPEGIGASAALSAAPPPTPS